METKRINAIVQGKVQGVFFRASTRDEAIRLGLVGWVRNLPDRTVEAEIEGDGEVVARMVNWLHQGPVMSSVSRVIMTEKNPLSEEKDFMVRY
jgi:acylphosphatase